MLKQKIETSFTLPGGQTVTLGTGRLARQANGAVTVTCGETILMAAVVANKEPRPGQSFFPLSVDYQEKFASAGRIPGSFFKRETKLSDYEVLISRLVDRALRPLFPEDYFCDVQVIINLISSDKEIMPDAMACLAASAALAVSDVPIQEIISEVRISRIDGKFVINPTRSQLENADMDFIIAATKDNIMMVEGEADECSEEDLVQALQQAHEAIRQQIAAQEELRRLVGDPEKRAYDKPYRNDELRARISNLIGDRLKEIMQGARAKHDRRDAFKALKEGVTESLGEISEEDAPLVDYYFEDILYYTVRNMILDDKVRLDGRDLTTVRPLDMEVNILPMPHGSALFTRGETQSLTTVTFGTKLDELLLENASTSEYTKFYLHYNFPPYSTGEVKMLRAPGRREVGHGNLAMRSLRKMMPKEDYPYTVRVVSDILESNGSSSMATVCAGSLALMDAGVPLPNHVGGVAMGLISRKEDKKYAILTDILGDEDHLGDMDFKVTGTRNGICGVQMDIKIDGLSSDIMREALNQAKEARLHILDAMYSAIPSYREEMKPHAPRMVLMYVDTEFIGAIIGPGGKIIQEIQKTTGTTINIEETNNRGEVSIFGTNQEGVKRAENWIKSIVAVPIVGEIYEATVKSIMPYGAFVEFLPGKQGLLHISEVTWKRLESLDGILREGDMVKVKLTGTDPKTGKFKLSRKVLLPKPENPPKESEA